MEKEEVFEIAKKNLDNIVHWELSNEKVFVSIRLPSKRRFGHNFDMFAINKSTNPQATIMATINIFKKVIEKDKKEIDVAFDKLKRGEHLTYEESTFLRNMVVCRWFEDSSIDPDKSWLCGMIGHNGNYWEYNEERGYEETDIEEMALIHICTNLLSNDYKEVSFGYLGYDKDNTHCSFVDTEKIEDYYDVDSNFLKDALLGVAEEWEQTNLSLKEFIKPYINLVRIEMYGDKN